MDAVIEDDENDEADEDEESQEDQERNVEVWHGFGNGTTGEDVEESGDDSSIEEDESKSATRASQPMLPGLRPSSSQCSGLTVE